MFDRSNFDRGAFDRSVSNETLDITMLGVSKFGLRLTVITPIASQVLSGSGVLYPGIRLSSLLNQDYTGSGDISPFAMVFRLRIGSAMAGSGALEVLPEVAMPIGSVIMSGIGDFKSEKEFLYQTMISKMEGVGLLDAKPFFLLPTSRMDIYGSGELATGLRFLLPITADMFGSGDFILRRLSALDESVFELDGINLLPGETVIVDTDILTVTFGVEENVNAVTNDSVFFELLPGENDIAIETDSGSALSVTAIWQNRWL